MRKTCTVLAVLMLAGGVCAQNFMIAVRRGPDPTPTYLIEEDFEEPGYELLGWEETGTPDPQYATSPAPLDGSYSWRTTNSADTAYHNFNDTDGETWAYYMFSVADRADEPWLPGFYDDEGERLAAPRILSSGAIRIYRTTIYSVFGTGTVTNGGVYHMWLQYTSGTNGASTAWVSSTTTRGANTASKTTAADVGDATRFWLDSVITPASGIIVDKVRAKDGEISDDPS